MRGALLKPQLGGGLSTHTPYGKAAISTITASTSMEGPPAGLQVISAITGPVLPDTRHCGRGRLGQAHPGCPGPPRRTDRDSPHFTFRETKVHKARRGKVGAAGHAGVCWLQSGCSLLRDNGAGKDAHVSHCRVGNMLYTMSGQWVSTHFTDKKLRIREVK